MPGELNRCKKKISSLAGNGGGEEQYAMPYTIREADINDYQDICLLNGELGYEYPPEKTRQRLERILPDETAKIYVAEADSRVVGYIHTVGYECAYVDSMKDILALVVTKTCRGQGIGRALLATAEDWAKRTAASGVRLVSGIDRAGAHRFYEACGYVNRKTQKNFEKKLNNCTLKP